MLRVKQGGLEGKTKDDATSLWVTMAILSATSPVPTQSSMLSSMELRVAPTKPQSSLRQDSLAFGLPEGWQWC